jgi:hypothetical protein
MSAAIMTGLDVRSYAAVVDDIDLGAAREFWPTYDRI